MGVVTNKLADFVLTDGRECQIELNEGDLIHIHFPGFRMDLSVPEYLQFATIIEDALFALTERKTVAPSRA